MEDGIEVEQLVRATTERQWTSLKAKVADFSFGWLTVSLLKVLGVGGVSIYAAVLNYPPLTAALVTGALAALMLHAVVVTRMLKKANSSLRWQRLIPHKRGEQRRIRQELAVQEVILALTEGRRAKFSHRVPSELRAALSVHTHRLHLLAKRAEAAEAVKAGTATGAQKRALIRAQKQPDPTPSGPNVEKITRHRNRLSAEVARLEAEIQALASEETIERAMNTPDVKAARQMEREEAKRSTQADKAARARVRSGLTPTAEEPGATVAVRVLPNGNTTTSRGAGTPTPEQIARGDDASSTATDQ